jgi:hypothetical protein
VFAVIDDDSKFTIPVEVFVLIATTFIVLNILHNLDHRLRFMVLYPIIMTIIGVVVPLCVILRSQKMRKTVTGSLKNVLTVCRKVCTWLQCRYATVEPEIITIP